MTTTAALSQYEIERNKPMPSFNHGSVQANLIYLIKLEYNNTLHDPILDLSIPLKEVFE
jgi:hypothetical protein